MWTIITYDNKFTNTHFQFNFQVRLKIEDFNKMKFTETLWTFYLLEIKYRQNVD